VEPGRWFRVEVKVERRLNPLRTRQSTGNSGRPGAIQNRPKRPPALILIWFRFHPVRPVNVSNITSASYPCSGRSYPPNGKRKRSHVFRIVLSCSRKAYSETVFHQTTDNFLRCLENAFWYFGGVPQTIVIDNLKAAVSKADRYDPEIVPKLQSFCAHYGTAILPAKPYMPRHKGKVENSIKYVKSNARKGRQFHSRNEQNDYLSGLASSLEIRLQEAAGNKLSYEQFLELILQDELLIRQERLIQRRFKQAGFRELKPLEDFDWQFNRSVKRKQIYDFASCKFIRQTEDILFLGPPGTGKSYRLKNPAARKSKADNDKS